ncbi:hypothetical protein ACOZ9X_17840 [Fictibacillus nanhaiensis]
MKAKSAFLAHSPFACRGCTSRFAFQKVPLILQESRPSAPINYSVKKLVKDLSEEPIYQKSSFIKILSFGFPSSFAS